MAVRKGCSGVEVCRVSYLDERSRGEHLGEVPYFFPEMGQVANAPLSQLLVRCKSLSVFVFNACFKLIHSGGSRVFVLP